MTITYGGNGMVPFDTVEVSANSADVQIDIRDDTSQNFVIVTGVIGFTNNGIYGRTELRDASNNNLFTNSSDARGRIGSMATTSTTAWTGPAVSTNFYSIGNLDSDATIAGERLHVLIFMQLHQITSQPFLDIHYTGIYSHLDTAGNAIGSRSIYRAQTTGDPRKLNFYASAGSISQANLRSYVIGGT